MKEYTMVRAKEALPELHGVVFDPEDCDFCYETPFAPIDSYVWGQGYMPEARAYAAWDEGGLHVLMCALEETVQAAAQAFNDEVYLDSCLEFFLKPFENDERYLNIEVNAGGVALIGIGSGRAGRERLAEMPGGMNMQASRHRGGWWAVRYDLPNAMFEALFGQTPKPGGVMRGNFYKCDESIHPHFGSWSPIVHFRPDFHRPEWFGKLVLEM